MCQCAPPPHARKTSSVSDGTPQRRCVCEGVRGGGSVPVCSTTTHRTSSVSYMYLCIPLPLRHWYFLVRCLSPLCSYWLQPAMMTPSRYTERRMTTGEEPSPRPNFILPQPPLPPLSSFRVCCGSLEGHESTVWSISFEPTGNRLGGW